jgi:hypothetical protein
MKKTITTIILALVFINVNAQAPDWAWAKSISGPSADAIYGITTDTLGNVYIIGDFGSTINLGTTTLTSAGNQDIFIVKYDPAGNVIWAKSAGGTGIDYGRGITCDKFGNIYVTGSYRLPSCSFGSTILTNTNTVGRSLFLVKYNDMGDVLWARNTENYDEYDNSLGLTTDASGNVYISGNYAPTFISFGTDTLTNTTGSFNMFLTKYNTMGDVLWAKKSNNMGSEQGNAIDTDTSGNVILIGTSMAPSMSFGTSTFNNMGYRDVFIVKYDSLGNVLWADCGGSIYWDYGGGIVTDLAGNIFITGHYQDAFSLGSFTITNAGGLDMFIAKYDASGNVIWLKGVGSAASDYGVQTVTDAFGNVYIVGFFESPVLNIDTISINNNGLYDFLVLKYDGSGNFLWAKGAGGNNRDYAYVITIDVFNNVLIGGHYESQSLILGSDTLANSGMNDAFVAKLGNTSVSIDESIFQAGINIYPNPTSGIFTIQNSNLRLQSCTIKNLLGAFVYTQNSNLTNQINIDLSAQAKGIYFVELFDENNSRINKKVIIE